MSSDLWTEIRDKTRDLDACIKSLRETGTAYATAERDYRLKLREEALRLRDDGMAIGLIDITCRGIPEVARLRFDRDIKRMVYEANRDAVNATKLELRIIDNQLSREYARPPADM